MKLQGELRGDYLAPVVKSLNTASGTGLLTVRTDEFVLTAVLLAGQPVFAVSNDPADRLDSVLMRRGLVHLPELTRATERMLQEHRRLGEILVDGGLLDRESLAEVLQIQIREILCRMLVLRRGTYSFAEQSVPRHEDIAFALSVNSLIRESFFSVTDFHGILDKIGAWNAVYASSESFLEEAAGCDLTPDQSTILPLFDEPVSLGELCIESAINDFDVCRLVWVLLTVGAISRLE